jgi:hypothetical protein
MSGAWLRGTVRLPNITTLHPASLVTVDAGHQTCPNTEVESCMKALMKTEKDGLTFVLTMNIPSPAKLGE